MTVRALAAFVVFWLALAAPLAACTRPALQPGPTINPVNIDQTRLARAILAEVNYHRCRVQLRELSYAGDALTQSSQAHSVWMAQRKKLSHTGRGASGRKMTDRVRTARLTPRTASENIAYLPLFQFGRNSFRVVDRNACHFLDAAGDRIPSHSYATLAREVVTMWIDSPGHRRNILDRDVTAMSTGAAVSQSRACGDVWVTQIFVG
ncbi:MAG: CAP domain-containing protein [Rhodobacteraceae bacterium]|nr:CAP domain-containing protein [Paracoccaceae bacterium]